MKDGVILHAKHAFMPNMLGYCGPDERGKIQQGIEGGKPGDDLINILQEFEAAYPFLKLIARSTGKDVFDYSVPEAYWIGNGLLDRVPVPDFYAFSHRDLQGRDPDAAHEMFRALNGRAPPHHTFYVMNTFAASGMKGGPTIRDGAEKKISEQIDNCRISWGKVTKVMPRELEVEERPVVLKDGSLNLALRKLKRVAYNPDVKPFGSIKRGATVSVHWNYACDVLTTKQVQNLERYTLTDIELTNALLAKRKV